MDKRVAFNFKIFYFLRFWGQGIFYPFLVLYLTGKGITGGQLGFLLMLLPLGKLLLSPLSGYICDLYRVHKPVLVLSMLLTVFGSAFFFFAEPGFGTYIFGILCITFGEISVDSLVNSFALNFLSAHNQQTQFGSLRLWGAVGFMAGTTIFGLFPLESALSVVPLIFAIANFLSFLAALTLPGASSRKPQDWLGGFKIVSKNRAFALMLVGVILSSTGFNVVMSFYSVYMRDIGAASWMIGVGLAMQTLVEILLSANTRRITHRFPLRKVYLAGFALMPLRCLLYIINQSPFVGMLIQNLHGFYIFSAFIVGLIVLDINLEPEWRSTGQSYYYSAFGGFGATFASLMGPLILEKAGVSLLFGFALVISILGFFVISGISGELIPKSKEMLQPMSE